MKLRKTPNPELKISPTEYKTESLHFLGLMNSATKPILRQALKLATQSGFEKKDSMAVLWETLPRRRFSISLPW